MSFADKLRQKGVGVPVASKRRVPLWKGPEEDGITFSLLSRFLVCRERFRVYALEGLRPQRQFEHRSEFGSMWHVCEQEFALIGWNETSQATLRDYASRLCRLYPTAQEQIDHWYNVCKVTFPLYVEYWSRHPDVLRREPLLSEQVFDVPYKLPSGRTVRLRGKWDSVDLVRGEKSSAVWLQENKTKGDIREGRIAQQLTFDAQVMMYVIALSAACSEYNKTGEGQEWIEPISHNLVMHPFGGVRYNVVRRPLSGGKGTIVRHKPTKSNPAGEGKEEFYQRLASYIKEAPETYFMRWDVGISPADVERFKTRCLDPILEQLCDWWEWVGGCAAKGLNVWDNDVSLHCAPWGDHPEHPSAVHWQHPFGVWNSLNEGGSTDLDNYLTTGSEQGLERVQTLYSELEEPAS